MTIINKILLINFINLQVLGYQNITKSFNINNFSAFDEILDNIFNNCFKKCDTVIISDVYNNEKSFTSLPNLYSSLSVVLYSRTKLARSLNNWKTIYTSILFINTTKYLEQTLTYFRTTFYALHSKKQLFFPFFIINQFENGCKMYEKILTKMWKFNIIAYFICVQSKGNNIIYTFNPFTNHTPYYWKFIKTVKEFENNNWAIFSREYDKENICHELDFDRSKFLNGYKVTIAAPLRYGLKNSSLAWKTIKSNNFLNVLQDTTPSIQEIIRGIVSGLNISAIIFFVPNLFEWDYKSEIMTDLLKNSSIDLFIQSFASKKYYFSMFEYTAAISYHQSGILSYFQGYKTPIEKIRDFYGVWILLYTFFILAITFVVIWFITRKVYFATFEIIRLLITAGLYTSIETLPRRIFFTMIFLYFLIIQATFSGHLSEFLTKPEPRKQAETLKDLMDPRFKEIYAPTPARYFMEELIENKDVLSYSITKGYCWKKILNNTSVACVNNYDVLFAQMHMNQKLYVSKKPFNYQYAFYLIRMNWHLSDRINQVFLWIWQSGLREHWDDRGLKELQYYKSVYDAMSYVEFSPISLNELTFAFIILGTGLTCGIISFIFELLKHSF